MPKAKTKGAGRRRDPLIDERINNGDMVILNIRMICFIRIIRQYLF
jgi:hypothetical protein